MPVNVTQSRIQSDPRSFHTQVSTLPRVRRTEGPPADSVGFGMKTKTELFNELVARLSVKARRNSGYSQDYQDARYIIADEIASILALPDGTVSVPKVPTEAMMNAGIDARETGYGLIVIYTAMIAAHLESLK